jgi:hypothetical protein
VKATGTGNTGWQAGPEADTGWRNIAYTDPNASANWTAGSVRVRRIGSLVQVVLFSVAMTALGGANFIYSLPVGLRPNPPGSEPLGAVLRESSITGNPVWFNISVEKVGYQADPLKGTFAGTWRFSGSFPTFTTLDPWPSSLPGVAA